MKWYFSISQQRLWNAGNWRCEARSVPIEGHTPIELGTYELGEPEYSSIDNPSDLAAYGVAFMALNTNNGKGLHSGGTGLENPLAPQQGWVPTEGCIRVQGIDLAHIIVSRSPGDTLEVMA